MECLKTRDWGAPAIHLLVNSWPHVGERDFKPQRNLPTAGATKIGCLSQRAARILNASAFERSDSEPTSRCARQAGVESLRRRYGWRAQTI